MLLLRACIHRDASAKTSDVVSSRCVVGQASRVASLSCSSVASVPARAPSARSSLPTQNSARTASAAPLLLVHVRALSSHTADARSLFSRPASLFSPPYAAYNTARSPTIATPAATAATTRLTCASRFFASSSSSKSDNDDVNENDRSELRLGLGKVAALPPAFLISLGTGAVAMAIFAWPYLVSAVFYSCATVSVASAGIGVYQLLHNKRKARRAQRGQTVAADDTTIAEGEIDEPDYFSKQFRRVLQWWVGPALEMQERQQQLLGLCLQTISAHPVLGPKFSAGAHAEEQGEVEVLRDNGHFRFRVPLAVLAADIAADVAIDATVPKDAPITFRVFSVKIRQTGELFDLSEQVQDPKVIDVQEAIAFTSSSSSGDSKNKSGKSKRGKK